MQLILLIVKIKWIILWMFYQRVLVNVFNYIWKRCISENVNLIDKAHWNKVAIQFYCVFESPTGNKNYIERRKKNIICDKHQFQKQKFFHNKIPIPQNVVNIILKHLNSLANYCLFEQYFVLIFAKN